MHTCTHKYWQYTATSMLTTRWSMTAGNNWISIKWKSSITPKFWTKQESTCWTMESHLPYYRSSFRLSPQADTLVQSNHKHWSACDITITLIFNPASLDPGKTLHVLTSEALGHVIKRLVNSLKRLIVKYSYHPFPYASSWVIEHKHMCVSM